MTAWGKGLVAGYEKLAAWSDVLDEINVFPVADGDTGRNLVVTLSPLRQADRSLQGLPRRLLLTARGNSGNIAARFLSGLLGAADVSSLPSACSSGCDRARQAVHRPLPGTMLSVFDALAEFLARRPPLAQKAYVAELMEHLAGVTAATPRYLTRLQQAGVVDAGALGMFIFLDGFFQSLPDGAGDGFPIGEYFKGALKPAANFQAGLAAGYCVDTVIQAGDSAEARIRQLAESGDSVVIIPDKDVFKVHLHTRDMAAARKAADAIGAVVRWESDDLCEQNHRFGRRAESGAVHIMTDAAGSISREEARRLGITLLESYLTVGDRSMPETRFYPQALYQAMREGRRVSTAQASAFERRQYYRRVFDLHPHVLYLCVGSVYTGNYDVACDWKRHNDPQDRFTVVDTTAASGRLAVLAVATVRCAAATPDPRAVVAFARRAIPRCQEFIFLDRLKYLAAGGRLSKSSALFGDALHLKPVISPTAEGARKVGAVRHRSGQLAFALRRLEAALDRASTALILLQHSDNRPWVEQHVRPEILNRFPDADLRLHPLSLTAGAHMGPGTWAVAFMPDPPPVEGRQPPTEHPSS
jgi:DegV family protein with EDD domain